MKAISHLEAFVFTADSVLHTTDGGATWNDASPASHPVVAAGFFLDARYGWIASEGDSPLDVWSTTDGGETWQESGAILESPEGIGGAHFDFIDASRGWMTVTLPGLLPRSIVYYTNNGGRSWTAQGTARLAGPIAFVDDTHGWAVGDGSKLYTTKDAGASWAQVQLPAPKGTEDAFMSVAPPQFTSPTDGVVETLFHGGNSVLIAEVTHDGGATWAASSPIPVDASEIDSPPAFWAMDSHEWFIAGPEGLEITRDAGETWRNIAPSMSLAGTWSVDFTTSESGWVLVGSGSCQGFKTDCTNSTLAASTSDGGLTWTTSLANTSPTG